MSNLNPSNWVSLYADYLLQYALFRLNDVSTCEDLVQETFLSALKAQKSFKGDSSEKTWLTAILRNKIIDEYRKKKPNYVSSDADVDDSSYGDYFETSDKGQSHWKSGQVPQLWDLTAEDKWVSKEYVQALRKCIGNLSDKQASLLQEKYFEETPSEKICKDFNLTKSNYWVMLHRINLQLRKCLEVNWFLS
jgi:RNA polymerase sigma-70 factor (TIGR02943 family)